MDTILIQHASLSGKGYLKLYFTAPFKGPNAHILV